MSSKRKLFNWFSLALIVMLVALLAGCAAKKQFWGDPNTGLILQYQLVKGEQLKYQITNKMKQNLEVMGQSMENNMNTSYLFTVDPKGLDGKNHLLDITVEDMKINFQTPRGEVTPDVSTVIGKNFAMSLSFVGKESNMDGAKLLKYNTTEGERNIASDFQTIFPDLAGKPIKVGDSWTTLDTVQIEETNSNIELTFESENTLTGFETIDGMECAKVVANVTGIMEGDGERGGANLFFEGDIKGTDTWYFAYKKGILVKYQSKGVTESTIAVSGPQNMTIPMTMDMDFETKLVK